MLFDSRRHEPDAIWRIKPCANHLPTLLVLKNNLFLTIVLHERVAAVGANEAAVRSEHTSTSAHARRCCRQCLEDRSLLLF